MATANMSDILAETLMDIRLRRPAKRNCGTKVNALISKELEFSQSHP